MGCFYHSWVIINLLKQVAIQKPLNESSEAMASHCNKSLDESYINKNDINEAQGPVPVAESDVQNAK